MQSRNGDRASRDFKIWSANFASANFCMASGKTLPLRKFTVFLASQTRSPQGIPSCLGETSKALLDLTTFLLEIVVELGAMILTLLMTMEATILHSLQRALLMEDTSVDEAE